MPACLEEFVEPRDVVPGIGLREHLGAARYFLVLISLTLLARIRAARRLVVLIRRLDAVRSFLVGLAQTAELVGVHEAGQHLRLMREGLLAQRPLGIADRSLDLVGGPLAARVLDGADNRTPPLGHGAAEPGGKG